MPAHARHSNKWFVTGATGMLGRQFVSTHGSRCVAMVRDVKGLPCDTVAGDLRDCASTATLIKKIKPEACFHFAACTDLEYCQQHPQEASLVNGKSTAALAAACSTIGARLVYMCTDAIFDGSTGNYSEDDALGPLNVYAETKLEGEKAALSASVRNISVRCNIFGTEAKISRQLKLYDWALSKLKNREAIIGFRDVFFNPLSVTTLSYLVADMVLLDLPGGLWHLGSQPFVSKDQFIRMVARANGLSDDSVTSGLQSETKLRPARPRNTTLRTDKMQRFGFSLPNIETELNITAQAS
jgi:dTDP-4-dehydrorhamnose reductase